MARGRWKPIHGDKPDFAKFLIALKKGMPGVVESPKKDFESFVGTWREKPAIIVKVEEKRGNFEAFVGVESQWSRGSVASPEDIFMFLARGTSVRYATMEPDFIPKTRVGRIASGPGGGNRDPLYVDRRTPNPGIDAREIEETVASKRKAKIISDMQKLVVVASKAAKL